MKVHATTALLVLPLSLLQWGCGGGEADSRNADSATASEQHSAVAAAAVPPPAASLRQQRLDAPLAEEIDFTAAQLADCPNYAFRVPVSQVKFDAPCVVGRYTGQSISRMQYTSREISYSRATAPATYWSNCSVSIRSDNTAVVQIGPRQATVSLAPTGTGFELGTTYGVTSFLERKITGRRIHLDAQNTLVRNGQSNTATLQFSATHYDDGIPGWQLQTWVQHPDLEEGGEIMPSHAVGCVKVVEEPAASPAWVTTLSEAQLRTCPDSLSPVTLKDLPCLTGTVMGVAVHAESHELLTPRQTCFAAIRSDGMIWTRMGDLLSAHRLETRQASGPLSEQGSHLAIAWRGDGGYIQRFQSIFYEDWGPDQNQRFHMLIHRPYDGSPMTLDIRMDTAHDVRCIAVLPRV